MAKKCEKCGACTEVCPIVEVKKDSVPYHVFTDENFNIWHCCSCFLCEENCPNELSVREEIFKQRRAIDLKNYPSRIKKYYDSIKDTGFVFPMDDVHNLIREKIGLRELNLKKIKSDIKKMVKKTEEGDEAEA